MKTKSFIVLIVVGIISSCQMSEFESGWKDGWVENEEVTFSSMKKITTTPYFYYYAGERQYLELDTRYIFVSVSDEQAVRSFNSNKAKLVSFNVDIPERIQSKTKNKRYCAELEIGDNLSNEAYLTKLEEIKNSGENIIVAPFFKNRHGEKIGLSNFFSVMLKSLNDTVLLHQEAMKEHAIIVYQQEFSPLWFILSVTENSRYNAMEMANLFHETGLFKYAEPDLNDEIQTCCATDPDFGFQWGLLNIGQVGGTNGIDMNICDAWQVSTGVGVTVAVIDQGIQMNHSDLAPNILGVSFDSESGNWQQAIHNSSPHGTRVAGIIGAQRNNGIGIAGVAPNCWIMSVSNSMSSSALTYPARADAINWAWQNGADVINCSWRCQSVSSQITTAINYAVTSGRGGKGCVVIFASGNDGASTVSYPANLSNVIAVGAINRSGQRSSWADYGNDLDVVAPGEDIRTTNPNNNYIYDSGTSYATPHVAGVAALLLSVNPNLTQTQVRYAIESSCSKINPLLYPYTYNSNHPNGTWHSNVGHGLVNAFGALTSLIPVINPVSGLTCSSHTVSLSSSVPSFVTQIVWSCSSALNIVSGQGTSSVSINKNPYTSEQGAYLHANFQISGGGVVSKWIWVFFEPTSVLFIDSNEESTNAGGSITFNAGPTGAGTYEWRVTPSNGTQLSSYTHYCNVSFQYSGYYDIECRLITN